MADDTELMSQRREAYRAMTKDPDFLALPSSDRQEMSRKVLFPDNNRSVMEKVQAANPAPSDKPLPTKSYAERQAEMAKSFDNLGDSNSQPSAPQPKDTSITGRVGSYLTDTLAPRLFQRGVEAKNAIQSVLPFPGAVRALTGQKPRGEGDLGELVNPMPELAQDMFAAGRQGIANIAGPEAARTAEDALMNAHLLHGSGAGNLGLYRRQSGISEGRFGRAADVSPAANLRLSGPEPIAPAEQPVAPVPAPTLMSPAQSSANFFEKQLAAEEALRRSPEGARLLRAQLSQQEAMNPAPQPAAPEVIPPARAEAIAKGKARASGGKGKLRGLSASIESATPLVDQAVEAPGVGAQSVFTSAKEPAAVSQEVMRRGEEFLANAETQPTAIPSPAVQAQAQPVEDSQTAQPPATVEPAVISAPEVVDKIKSQQNPAHFDEAQIVDQVHSAGDSFVKVELDPAELTTRKGVEPGVSDEAKGAVVADANGKVIDGNHRVVDAKAAGETVTAYVPQDSPLAEFKPQSLIPAVKLADGSIAQGIRGEGHKSIYEALSPQQQAGILDTGWQDPNLQADDPANYFKDAQAAKEAHDSRNGIVEAPAAKAPRTRKVKTAQGLVDVLRGYSANDVEQFKLGDPINLPRAGYDGKVTALNGRSLTIQWDNGTHSVWSDDAFDVIAEDLNDMDKAGAKAPGKPPVAASAASRTHSDPLEGFSDDDILQLVKSGLVKQSAGEALTRSEFAAIEKFNGSPNQPWVQGPREVSSLDARQKNRARAAAESERRASLVRDLQATIDDMTVSEETRQMAREQLAEFGSPIDIADPSTQIGSATEVANESGQPGPNPSQLDVREPAGVSAPVDAAEQITAVPGQQDAASPSIGGQNEVPGDVGGGGLQPSSGNDLSPSAGALAGDVAGGGRLEAPATQTGTDAGGGAVSDNPATDGTTGRPGPTESSGDNLPQLEPYDPNSRNHILSSTQDWIPTGDRAKIKANIEAIRTLKTVESEGRNATPAEKDILAKYVGWGGLKPVFDVGKAAYRTRPGWSDEQKTEAANWEKNWGKAYDEVKGLLSRDEYASAASSIENAHYTSREVINGVWKAVERLGFSGGNALEPAAGNGNFIGLQPDTSAEHTRWRAVELDDVSGRIAQKLYPQAKVSISGFESAKIPLNTQDLVISNVPFAAQGPGDSRYPNLSLHNYFFVRGLDLVKPGGVMAAITSTSTMDNPGASDQARQMIADRADLIGAIRLPNNAFQKNAGTEVTTDVLFLRKRDLAPYKDAQDWRRVVDAQTDKGEPIKINEYFVKHPEMMLGRMSLEGTMRQANEQTLSPFPGQLLRDLLNEAVTKLPENVVGRGSVSPADIADGSPMEMVEGQSPKPGNLVAAKGGRVARLNEAGDLEALDWSEHPGKAQQARRYIDVREAARDSIIRQFDSDTSDDQIIQDRAELNRVYDAYVKKHGALNSRSSAFLSDDGDFPLALGLEDGVTTVVEQIRAGKPILRRETTWVKRAIFTQRTLFPREAPTHIDSVVDALQVSINYRGGVDIEYIAELTGIPVESVAAELAMTGEAFENPKTGIWQDRAGYLSGFVKEKLHEAQAAAADDPRFQRNADELKAVQPAPIDIANVGFKLGSKWIPPEIIQGFISDVLDVRANVSMTPQTGSWHVKPGNRYDLQSAANLTVYGIHDWRGDQIVEAALNLKNPIVYDYGVDSEGRETKTRNDTKTTEAKGKQEELQAKFKDYVLGNGEASIQLEGIYNDVFNGTVVPTFRGPSWDHYPGASTDVTLRPHQKEVASRMIQESTLLAHAVGTGKTYAMITAAMEQRRLGLAKKPMIVVQNATLEQFAASFKKLYPASRVYAPNAKARNGQERKAAMARIATGDWDAVIVPQSWYNRIADDPERVTTYIQDQIDALQEALVEARRVEGRRSPKASDIQRSIKTLRKQLEKLADRTVDDVMPFEQLGVDSLFVDEAHEYKKLQFFSQMDNVKGLDRSFSQQGLSMLMKVRFVQEKNQGRNVTFATGTPVSNTIAEAWNMMRYVRPDLLKQYHMEDFDSFAALFGDTAVNTELTAGGTWKPVTRFAKFINGPELIAAWRTMADVKTAEEVNLPNLPTVKGGQGTIKSIPQSPSFAKFVEWIRSELERFANMTGEDKRENSHIPLVMTGLAKKAALDMRLVEPNSPDDPQSKLNVAADEAMRIYTESTPVLGTQMMFADSIRDNPENPTFNAHEELRKKLIKRGIPASEIVVIDDSIKDEKRDMIFDQFNEGKIRIAIGSTKRMGIGVNAQKHMIGLHHLDAPWRPMDIEQREGRIVRQGNENPEVEILTYGVDRSLDAATFQLLATKQKFTNQILRGEVTGRNFEDSANSQSLTFEQQMAAFSGDPRAMEKVGLENDVRQLDAMRRGHIKDAAKGRQELHDATTMIIPGLTRDLASAEALAADYAAKFPFGTEYTVTIGGRTIAGKKDVVAALDAYFKQKMADMEGAIQNSGKHGTIRTNEFSEVTLNDAKIMMEVQAARTEKGNAIPEMSAILWRLDGLQGAHGTVKTGQGLFQGLTGQLDAIQRRPHELKTALASKERSVRELTGFVDKPFQREAELAEKSQRLAILTAQLEAEGANQGTEASPQIIDSSLLPQDNSVDSETDNGPN